jgi:hypothetical protein
LIVDTRRAIGLNGRASDFANFSPDPIGRGLYFGRWRTIAGKLRGGLVRTVKRRE